MSLLYVCHVALSGSLPRQGIECPVARTEVHAKGSQEFWWLLVTGLATILAEDDKKTNLRLRVILLHLVIYTLV